MFIEFVVCNFKKNLCGVKKWGDFNNRIATEEYIKDPLLCFMNEPTIIICRVAYTQSTAIQQGKASTISYPPDV